MLRNSCHEDVDNKENSPERSPDLPARSVVRGYIGISAYLASGANSSLSEADINNGYILPQGDLAAASRTNWLSGMKKDYIGPVPDAHGFSYLPTTKEPASADYVTSFDEINNSPLFTMAELESHAASINDEETRIRRLYDDAVEAYNARIDDLLSVNGFINRVDIKKGVTASVAVFEYVGEDPEIKAITKFGFVMVKLPPYTFAPENIRIVASASANENDGIIEYVGVDLPRKTITQVHAELTYNNEYNIINQMSFIPHDETRPSVLAKELNGQKFIFNSPVFYDEVEFIKAYKAILNGEFHRLFSSSDSIDDENSSNEDDVANYNQIAINSLLRQSFINLSCRMQRLAASKEDPIKVINKIFFTLRFAINKCHNDGFVHSDIASRNVVLRINNTTALVDWGPADTLNKVKGSARSNVKYPQTSIMHNNDALKEDHLIGVITDYISFQKTMLQSIADYIGADFYKLIIQGLPNASKVVCIEFLLQFTDRQIMDNVKNNLIAAAEKLISVNDSRGAPALQLVRQFEPYFDHDHNPNHTFAELQAANDASFDKCSPRAYIAKPRERTAERLNDYVRHVEERQNAPESAPAPIPHLSRASTGEMIGFFNNRSRANSDADTFRPLSRSSGFCGSAPK